MKLYAIITLFLSLVMFFFPFLSVSRFFNEKISDKPPESKIVISDSNGENQTETELFSYIVGVVAAEMPASFEEEALKAQAVAAYTYQKYLRENGSDVIIDGSINQEYKTDDELREIWGDSYEQYKVKIENAVRSVYGEYLTLDGKTIPAVYHAISPGQTESAEIIFGRKIACLVSVNAPGDSLSPKQSEDVTFSKKEAESLLKKAGITPPSGSKNLIEIKNKTDSGYSEKIKICDKNFNGNDIRDLFSLKSPFFDIKESENSITFTVYGRGHGVGMSQYSADYMARQGFSYKDILLHFYKGAEITV